MADIKELQKEYATTLLQLRRNIYQNFVKLGELKENFDGHVIEKLNAGDFICVTILLLQDFKDTIEFFKGCEIKNDQEVICFIRSAYELNIISEKYYKIFQDFNVLRNTMAHKILKQIRENSGYYTSLNKTWKDKIENFVKNRHNIYRCLLISLLEKSKKIPNKELLKLWRIAINIVIKDKEKEIKKLEDKYDDRKMRYGKVNSFITEEVAKFIKIYTNKS